MQENAKAYAGRVIDHSENTHRTGWRGSIIRRLGRLLIAGAWKRRPDFIIGGHENPYLLRWYLIPRNPVFNIYLHLFLRSDDDRALHDHPWVNCSFLLDGEYLEHTIAAGGIHSRRRVVAGDVRLRFSGRMAHRIELDRGHCWTLFVTGPRYRQWGFHCQSGWVHWQVFTSPEDTGSTGRGCE